MNMAEKVIEEIRVLPEFEVREVLDFVGYLKTRHIAGNDHVTQPIKAIDTALMAEVRGKVRTGVSWTREELYDRGLR
jgi:hypothetical protein